MAFTLTIPTFEFQLVEERKVVVARLPKDPYNPIYHEQMSPAPSYSGGKAETRILLHLNG